MRVTLMILVLTAACTGRGPAIAPIAEPPRAVSPDRSAAAPSSPGLVSTKPVVTSSLAAVGLDPDALDRSIDPCDDFYQFACGGWIKRIEIPADEPMAMRSVVDIEERNRDYAHEMLERVRTRPGTDPIARQLGTFYGSCMDEPAIEKAGLSALRPLLATIDRIKDARSLTAAIAAIDAAGFAGPFVVAPVQDAANARSVIAGIDQGGLGLPDRDFYLNGDESTRSMLTTYQAYVEGVLAAIGHRAAHVEAVDVLALETEIARISRDKAARRDPRRSYHKIDRGGVARAMPRLDWDAYWASVGLKDVRSVTVTSPELLAGLDRLVAVVRPEVWRSYLAFHVADEAAPLLTKQLEDMQFKFTSALTGQPEQSPRWKRCVNHTVAALGDLVGQMFVHDRFGGDSKVIAEDQIRAISAAMAQNLEALPWMDAVTRARAREKLDTMTYQIGYPSRWRSYGFKLDARTFAANALAARRAERARQLARIEQPFDKSEWQQLVPLVNVYYDPRLNGMVAPAGILQPPFFSAAAAIPVNLGAIGVVIGHHLTHGVDDQGALYDAAGNLSTWWEPGTEQRFRERSRCVAEQYSRYEVSGISGGIRLNGAALAGENVADIGGVKLALAAYRQLRSSASDTVVADGFTEDQQFFLGFGQAWCAKMRPDFERLRETIDVHAPAKWRVDGALAATPEFARAFRCKTGSKMVPATQCVVW